MISGLFPVLVSTAVFLALVLPNAVLGNVKVVTLSEAMGVPRAMPSRAMSISELPMSLELVKTRNKSERGPVIRVNEGLKVTPISQLEFGAKTCPAVQLLVARLATRKSFVKPMNLFCKVSGTLPTFFRVTVCIGLELGGLD